MSKWTHKYKYTMESPVYIPRIGSLITGTAQTDRAYSDAEVEALAKEMSHGVFNSAKLIKVELIERRN